MPLSNKVSRLDFHFKAFTKYETNILFDILFVLVKGKTSITTVFSFNLFKPLAIQVTLIDKMKLETFQMIQKCLYGIL